VRPGEGGWFEGETDGGAHVRLYGAAPGDLVELSDSPQRPGWGEASSRLERGPGSREPSCPLARRCGGCHWLHLDETTQAAWRARLVCERLEQHRVAGVGRIEVRQVPSPQPLGYRWRARFQSGFKDTAPTIGFHGLGDWRVVDVPHCPLLAPALARVYTALRDALLRLAPRDLTGFELTLLPGAAGALVTLNPRDRPPASWPGLGETLLADEACGLVGIAVSPSEGDGRPAILGERILVGTTPAGRPVAVAARGFLQANLAAADLMADEVAALARAAGGPRLIELYAGSGFLGSALAAAGARVLAVEVSGPAVEAARALPVPANCELRVLCDDARAAWDRLADDGWDVVVADPPRSGLGPLARSIAAQRPASRSCPRRIVLVSCSIASFARDASALASAGLRLEELVQVDLFPQTRHAETVASFVR